MSSENKETYWSKFAKDFETKNNYVVGIENLNLLYYHLLKISNLGNTLELGCGNGTFSKVIYPETSSLTATDYSDEMIEVAKNKLSSYQNIQIQKENCFSLSFNDQTFDTIFMANLLHIIPTPEQALKECYRVLKDNGKLIIVSYTTEGISSIDKENLIYRYQKTYGKPSPTAYVLTKELAISLVEQEQFKNVSCDIVGKSMNALIVNSTK